MHARIYSATTIGINAHLVDVECDLSYGMLQFWIVGLPDKAINESSERVKAALKNSGLRVPERKITINLAPASLKKEHILFDVPMTVAILQAGSLIELSKEFMEETIVLGELSLDGKIKPVRGVLAIVHAALKWGKKRVIIPKANEQEAALIEGIDIIGVTSLVELVAYLRGEQAIAPTPSTFAHMQTVARSSELDFNQVKGQAVAKRALQIAAAGRHNILFVGPPGSGKTMLARRLATIMPPMSFDEIIQVTKIYSIAGMLSGGALVLQRPFRAPHHTISQAGLIGGGSNPRPGEVTLSHQGVLFLDELPEFHRSTLEVLREPLENRGVLISRANCAVDYPASFLLVAALNPCPCGFYGDPKKKCVCAPQQISRYLAKISGPLLDRIDLHIPVTSVNYDEVGGGRVPSSSSTEMFGQVQVALDMQAKRGKEHTNALMSAEQVERYCELSGQARDVMKLAFERLGLSMRGYHKILKIARTIADLEGADVIERQHIQEAITYRSLDQKLNAV